MKHVHRVLSLLRNLLRSDLVEDDLDREARSLLDLLAEEKMAAGLSAQEAHREARLEIGGPEQLKERVRDVRAGAVLGSIGQDLRYGLRALRKNPAFSIIAVLTLGLGIGANTAIFSVVNAVVLRPLAFSEPDRIMVIWTVDGGPHFMSAPEYFDFKERQKSFDHFGVNVLVRTATEPYALLPALREEVASLDSTLPLYETSTLQELYADVVSRPRFTALLVGVFAFVALALGCVGLYGVIAYSVSQREQEIGIRMVLGSSPARVRHMVVRQGMSLAGAGLVLGLGGAVGLTRFLRSLLFGVTATDWRTYAAVSALVIALAALACYLPARRATKLDPMLALRHE